MYPVRFGAYPVGLGGAEKFQWGCRKFQSRRWAFSMGALKISSGSIEKGQWVH